MHQPEDDQPSLHAPVIFFVPSSGDLAVYCYFCPENHSKIKPFQETTSTISISNVLKLNDQTNSQGHGHHLIVKYGLIQKELEKGSPCLRELDSAENKSMSVSKTYLCQLLQLNEYLSVSLNWGVRSWKYLSGRFDVLLRRWIEGGFISRGI